MNLCLCCYIRKEPEIFSRSLKTETVQQIVARDLPAEGSIRNNYDILSRMTQRKNTVCLTISKNVTGNIYYASTSKSLKVAVSITDVTGIFRFTYYFQPHDDPIADSSF
jgi:hypothetical protein